MTKSLSSVEHIAASMGLISKALKTAAREIDSFLVLDKRIHHTLVYAVTHVRSNRRMLMKKISRTLYDLAERIDEDPM